MLQSAVGLICSIDGKDFIYTEKGQVGFALFGPYQTFGPGSYGVTFNFWKPKAPIVNNDICCFVDVAADFGSTVLAKSTVLAARLNDSEYTPVELSFTLDQTRELEFRAYVTGATPVIIECDRVVAVASESQNRFAPILVGADKRHDEFFEKHFEKFRGLFDNGADVIPSESGTVVKLFDARLHVKHAEDFQLIEEIFRSNIYNFSSRSDVIVMDIGMNIGLSSLYFAKMPSVK